MNGNKIPLDEAQYSTRIRSVRVRIASQMIVFCHTWLAIDALSQLNSALHPVIESGGSIAKYIRLIQQGNKYSHISLIQYEERYSHITVGNRYKHSRYSPKKGTIFRYNTETDTLDSTRNVVHTIKQLDTKMEINHCNHNQQLQYENRLKNHKNIKRNIVT